MENLGTVNQEEIQQLRLLTLANILNGIKINYPLNNQDQFTLPKDKKGYKTNGDNFTYTWVIGLLPIIFGKHWAYSSEEKIFLKGYEEDATTTSIKRFFGLTNEEYFHLFVSYFQDVKRFGGQVLSHNLISGESVARNIRELTRIKLKAKTQKENEKLQKTAAHNF